ncbi:MAG TPA: hypothetical protein VLT16_19135 [Candidatus Limnocylindrales bacterium]|nr:hypothetical protein [Candidatus Limnocylindrales bacterium]
MNRSFLQMLSGALGLIAAFAAISIPLLSFSMSSGEAGPVHAGPLAATVLALTFAATAYGLLRFSLSHGPAHSLARQGSSLR